VGGKNKLGNFEKIIYTIMVYLPYLFVLIAIAFLIKGFYLKSKKKNSKKYYTISFICFILGIFILLLPVILLLIIRIGWGS
jgi:hypothetical protein